MPKLERLDGEIVQNKSLELAEATVERKKMFYNMRVQTHFRNMDEEITRLDHIKSQLINLPNSKLTALNYVVKAVRIKIQIIQYLMSIIILFIFLFTHF